MVKYNFAVRNNLNNLLPMSTLKIAINGFGRIGRLVFRALQQYEQVEIVAINDLTSPDTLAHLLKYDTAQGKFPGTVTAAESQLVVNGKAITVYAQKDPANLPWASLGIDIVLECTGIFRDREGCMKHIAAGAKKVLISSPAKGDVKTVVLGVNEEILTADDQIISNASCTTNCLGQMVKVLNDAFGIEKAFVTTIHAYTADQRLQDAPHSDLRRARAAAQNIIPTSTNAGTALGVVLPASKGKIDATAIRVPVITGSLTEMVAILENEADATAINKAYQTAAEGKLKGYLEYTEDEIVSSDIVGNTHACIFDAKLTKVTDKLVKVTGWYDNEVGYAHRLADLVIYVSKL